MSQNKEIGVHTVEETPPSLRSGHEDQHSAGWRSACCEGERCFCGAPADRKVEETIFDDDWSKSDDGPWGAMPKVLRNRHPLTAYVCFEHFAQMMGPAAIQQDAMASSRAEGSAGNIPPDEPLCSDCPPVGYPTDKTRCAPCPRRPHQAEQQ
jgi:hypothetical protein